MGVVIGGYFIWQDPELLDNFKNQIEAITTDQAVTTSTSNAGQRAQTQVSSVLGKTTELVEEGLQNLKVPKQLSGGEEIVLEELFDELTQKIQHLPVQQVDRVKVEFCQDLLRDVPNVSLEVRE